MDHTKNRATDKMLHPKGVIGDHNWVSKEEEAEYWKGLIIEPKTVGECKSCHKKEEHLYFYKGGPLCVKCVRISMNRGE